MQFQKIVTRSLQKKLVLAQTVNFHTQARLFSAAPGGNKPPGSQQQMPNILKQIEKQEQMAREMKQ